MSRLIPSEFMSIENTELDYVYMTTSPSSCVSYIVLMNHVWPSRALSAYRRSLSGTKVTERRSLSVKASSSSLFLMAWTPSSLSSGLLRQALVESTSFCHSRERDGHGGGDTDDGREDGGTLRFWMLKRMKRMAHVVRR